VSAVQFGDRLIGPGHPCFVIAEIGINHSGSLETAIQMIDAAHAAGADAVKFQAGDPEKYVNRSAWKTPRETPWGTMPYIEYRKLMEFSAADFNAIDTHCFVSGIEWFVSPLDAESVDRFEPLAPVAYKVASPKLTDVALLDRLTATHRPLLLSTGMSTFDEVDTALAHVNRDRIALLHCTSQYPCPDDATNLPAICTLRARYPEIPIGYSGHESGIWPTLAAVTLGACVVERHFTTDRTAWGSDQAASLEPNGFAMMVKGIRSIERALSGDGRKILREGELPNYQKFRSVA
jgi:N-acetylneuraminate synthase